MASKNRGLSDGSCPGFEWKYHLFPIPSYMQETLSCPHCNKIFKLPYYTVKYEHWPSFFAAVYFENMDTCTFKEFQMWFQGWHQCLLGWNIDKNWIWHIPMYHLSTVAGGHWTERIKKPRILARTRFWAWPCAECAVLVGVCPCIYYPISLWLHERLPASLIQVSHLDKIKGGCYQPLSRRPPFPVPVPHRLRYAWGYVKFLWALSHMLMCLNVNMILQGGWAG